MHSTSLRLLPVLLSGLSLLAAPVASHAAQPLSEDDQKFMVIYEQVLKALVTGNVNAVKDAAHALPGGQGEDLLKSNDLKAERDAFAVLSQAAEKKVVGNPSYHVFYCPMAKKDWVQETTTVANPYMGNDMLTCGVEKKNN